MITYNQPSVGDIIHVRITSIVESIGVFVRMPNGRDGLIRIIDFAWFNQGNILKSFSVGDELDVKVIKMLPDGKLNLSRKEILPNPRTIEKGAVFCCCIKRIEPFGMIVQLGDFTALIHKNEIPVSEYYSEGDSVTAVVIDNTYDCEKHYNKISMSILALHDYVAKQHKEKEIVKCTFKKSVQNGKGTLAIIEFDSKVTLKISENRFIEPYRSQLLANEIEEGEVLEFEYSYNQDKRAIKLDMRPIERNRKTQEIEWLASQLHEGDIVEAEVLSVNDKNAIVRILNTNVECSIPREELSPNKVVRATDEVFMGEHIRIVYMGGEDGLSFSRRFLVKDMYPESLYELPQPDLLATMGLATNKFVGKIVEINSDYFVTNLMTIGLANDEENGKLLIDPLNGKNLIAIIDQKLRNFFVAGEYYEVELELAKKEYRKKSGTPYMFRVASTNIKACIDPYKESVFVQSKQHMSPNTNTSMANLLEEVGKNLYSSKKRMFFELLQNADDSASENGVKIKLQISDNFFVLTHNGYAFNRHDFESITSAAKSTKRASEKKTGYKGIGFKSVFTNSQCVIIYSGGYKFSFDKNNPLYNDFDGFYFRANKIENDPDRQKEFLHDFSKYRREFNGVKDIPWQLLPIWTDDFKIDDSNSIFNSKENVSIALRMDKDTLSDYSKAIKEVFEKPRFMLFLRNTNRVQLMRDNECLTIQKNKSDDGKIVSLINSFAPLNTVENYNIRTFDKLEVNDDVFSLAGIFIKRDERYNNRGETENYFVRIDESGNVLGEVTGIPDRIASTKDTIISFAIKLGADGHIVPLESESLSLYAYLPMNEHRYKFPFYVNADFIPKSDREGVQSDNPWNHFIFYNIGKLIVSMVADYASIDEPNYLNLLPSILLQSDSQESTALTATFNRAYQEALEQTDYILTDQGEKVNHKQVIYDETELADIVGHSNFYEILQTSKRLPHKSIDAQILCNDIFGVEVITSSNIVSALRQDISRTKLWIANLDDASRKSFFDWMVNLDEPNFFYAEIPSILFENEFISYDEVSSHDNYIITTRKISNVTGILRKLNFVCSISVFEDHPFSGHWNAQNEKALYNKISKENISALSFEDRFSLFECCLTFEEVGKETVRNWRLFMNSVGEFMPLNLLCSINDYPEWLGRYVVSNKEYRRELDKYLVKEDDIYANIIAPNIFDLVEYTDVWNVYKAYRDEWQPQLTKSLIGRKIENILPIVERSDKEEIIYYLDSIDKIKLSSDMAYDVNSKECRILQLALSTFDKPSKFAYKIFFDEKCITSFTISDEVKCNFSQNGEQREVVFSLAKLLPGFDEQSEILCKLKYSLKCIGDLDKFFEAKSMPLREIVSKLESADYLKLKSGFWPTDKRGNAHQYLFYVYYYRWVMKYTSTWVIDIKLEEESELFIIEMMDYLFKNNICIDDSPFGYRIRRYFKRKYMSCDYILDDERLLASIEKWSDTLEKKQYLIKQGVNDVDCKEILRRKAFKEKKAGSLWNISDSKTIEAFLDWVLESINLPITDSIQVDILESLSASCNSIDKRFYEEDFLGGHEWINDLYLVWKQEHNIKFFLLDGQMPYRGYYRGKHLFNAYGGDYKYYPESNKIYLSVEKEIAVILSEVYSDKAFTHVFTKDDWNNLFLVSADIVQEKDLRIAELERLLLEARNKEAAENDYDDNADNHGNATDRDNLEEKTRAELNREARNAAKDYLDSLEDYDCSEWEPNIGNGLVKGIIKYKGKNITLVVTCSLGRKLYLHPRLFAELMTDPDNLLLNYGYDRRIHRITFDETFRDNKDVNLIFDADKTTSEEFAFLANRYMYSKGTCFVIENITYSISEQIKGFGLDEKMSDTEVYTDVNFDEMFSW